VHLGDRFLILGIGSPPLHSDGHDRPGESATDGTFPSDPSTKTGCQPRKKRILVTKILLETQGDRFSSVESFLKIILRLLANRLSVLCFFHVVSPAWLYGLLTDMLEEVNLAETGVRCATYQRVNLEMLLSKIAIFSRPLRPVHHAVQGFARVHPCLPSGREVPEKIPLVRFPERGNQTKTTLFRTGSCQLESNRPLNDSTQRLQPSVISVRFVRDRLSFGWGYAALCSYNHNLFLHPS